MQQGKSDTDAAKATTATFLSPLTRREQEVLELMAFGLANKEIAHRLSLSRRTVETHIDHVLGKLNAATRARAVVEAGRAGLLGGTGTSAAASAADSRPNNLPFQLTTLLGRDQDLVEVKSLIEAHRLVTLSGSGGVGKTRLALRIGVDLLDVYPNGAWLCDFSPISDPILITSAVAKVLVVRERQNRPLAESIVESLKGKRALLIFDNCEHVLDATAELVDEILHNCPNIQILATSRQALGIVGELVYRVRSLSLPDSAKGLKADEGSRYGAIALFVDRAHASDARFGLTNENAPIVAEICCRLDGIPLAIELAATRSNVINLNTLARGLNDRFNVLTAGGRTALPRHKTLGALIDWSYDLLTTQEQALFKRLSIFAGGFSLAAARVVCWGDGLDEIDILDLLSSLTDKSLVVADTAGDHERYRLLESTRAYALEKLTAGRGREGLARRHAEYFRDEAQAAAKRWGTGPLGAWLAGVELERDNYRTVLEWSLTDGHDIALGGAVAGSLVRLWFDGGLTVEGRYWIERAQAALDESAYPQVAARLWFALAVLSDAKRKHDLAERSIALYRSAGDRLGAATALKVLGFSFFQMGRLEQASEATASALAALCECGPMVDVASSLSQQGIIAWHLGDVAGGRELFTQALAAFKDLKDDSGTAQVLSCLAELEFADGQFEQALRLAAEALETHAGGKNAGDIAIDYVNIAAYSLPLGDADGARKAAREGLRWARQGQYALGISIALQHFASLGALCGQLHNAARLIGYVNAQYTELGSEREYTEKWSYEKLVATLRERLSAAEIDKLAAEGAAWSEDQAVEEALKV
jgi:predicted ATPase/DNA-binding CsgD family transcriptional regulator/tetratricopeptide (TPR) repeat protein